MSNADTIYYNYGANHEELDGIRANLNDAIALQDDVNKVFAALDGVYEGEAKTALMAAHKQINQKMDECITDLRCFHQQGVDCQVNNAQLDHQLSCNLQ